VLDVGCFITAASQVAPDIANKSRKSSRERLSTNPAGMKLPSCFRSAMSALANFVSAPVAGIAHGGLLRIAGGDVAERDAAVFGGELHGFVAFLDLALRFERGADDEIERLTGADGVERRPILPPWSAMLWQAVQVSSARRKTSPPCLASPLSRTSFTSAATNSGVAPEFAGGELRAESIELALEIAGFGETGVRSESLEAVLQVDGQKPCSRSELSICGACFHAREARESRTSIRLSLAAVEHHDSRADLIRDIPSADVAAS
jgi:hypothetical protein